MGLQDTTSRSSDKSRSFTPAAWLHHGSESQYAKDDQEKHKCDEQDQTTAQFVDHNPLRLVNIISLAIMIDLTPCSACALFTQPTRVNSLFPSLSPLCCDGITMLLHLGGQRAECSHVAYAAAAGWLPDVPVRRWRPLFLFAVCRSYVR